MADPCSPASPTECESSGMSLRPGLMVDRCSGVFPVHAVCLSRLSLPHPSSPRPEELASGLDSGATPVGGPQAPPGYRRTRVLPRSPEGCGVSRKGQSDLKGPKAKDPAASLQPTELAVPGTPWRCSCKGRSGDSREHHTASKKAPLVRRGSTPKTGETGGFGSCAFYSLQSS